VQQCEVRGELEKKSHGMDGQIRRVCVVTLKVFIGDLVAGVAPEPLQHWLHRIAEEGAHEVQQGPAHVSESCCQPSLLHHLSRKRFPSTKNTGALFSP
jgi:hypothetical protein